MDGQERDDSTQQPARAAVTLSRAPCQRCGAEHYPIAGPDRPFPGRMVSGTVFAGDRCACGSPTETVAGYDPDGVTDAGRATVCARSGQLIGGGVPPGRCICGGPERSPSAGREATMTDPAVLSPPT